MPKRNFDDVTCYVAFNYVILINDTAFTDRIDMIDYLDAGINFHAGISYTSGSPHYVDGLYKFTLQHSDTLGGLYENVPEDDIIGDTSDYPYLKDLEITSQLADGQALPFVQAKNLKRYVSVLITSSGVTLGAQPTVIYNMRKHLMPVPRTGEIFDKFV